MNTTHKTCLASLSALIVSLMFMVQANVANAEINICERGKVYITEPGCICVFPWCDRQYNTILPHPIIKGIRKQVSASWNRQLDRWSTRIDRRQDRRQGRRADRQTVDASTTYLHFNLPLDAAAAYAEDPTAPDMAVTSFVPYYNDINFDPTLFFNVETAAGKIKDVAATPLMLTDGTLNIPPTLTRELLDAVGRNSSQEPEDDESVSVGDFDIKGLIKDIITGIITRIMSAPVLVDEPMAGQHPVPSLSPLPALFWILPRPMIWPGALVSTSAPPKKRLL